MSTHRWTILLGSLLVTTAGLIVVSSLILVTAGGRASGVARPRDDQGYTRHFILVGNRIDSAYWQDVYAGASAAAGDSGAVMELVGPASDAERKTPGEYIEYAVAARVDGILAYVNDSEATKNALALAAVKGIPVVALENDTLPEMRQSFVGINSYELGRIIGGLVSTTAGLEGHALVLLDSRADHLSETIMLSAIREVLQPYPGLSVSPLGKDEFPAAGYEEHIRQRILEDRALETIVCLSVEDAIRTAQTLIELNRSDRVSVISFHETKEVLEYLRKGIISAVIEVDAREMGRMATESLVEYLETGHSNNYVITGMHVVTRESLEDAAK